MNKGNGTAIIHNDENGENITRIECILNKNAPRSTNKKNSWGRYEKEKKKTDLERPGYNNWENYEERKEKRWKK